MNLNTLRRTAPWALAWVIAFVAPAVWAQSVDISGTTLDLGESKSRTLGVAGSGLNIVPTSTEGLYLLYPKVTPLATARKQGPSAMGSINFANGRLVRVTRNLGSFRSADGQKAIQNLIAAFARAPSQDKDEEENRPQSPEIHTDTRMSGDASSTRVYFSYPERVIQVSVFQPADMSVAATVNINEQYALSTDDQPTTAMPNR